MLRILINQFVSRGMVPVSMSELAAKEILTIIENTGMLPPSHSVEVKYESEYFPLPLYYKKPLNEWEPEDEKTKP